jgi:uridine kinase
MRTIIIGVAGGTASGKTTMSQRILEQVGAEHIAFVPHDAYYKSLDHLSKKQRRKFNFDHPDALETSLMIRHLKKLRNGKPVEIPVYNFKKYTRTDKTLPVDPAPIVLVEGILIFAEPKLRKLFDVKIFIDTPDDIRLIRRLTRDIHERGRSFESVIKQYMRTVRPMHLEFVEPSKRHADVIIPGGGYNEVAIDMVAARIRWLLAHRKIASATE